jgi:hypothetical protein
VSRPRRSLRRLPRQLTVADAARLLRLPEVAIDDAIRAGELATASTAGGPLLVDTRALLVDLGVPADVIGRLARRWPPAGEARGGGGSGCEEDA